MGQLLLGVLEEAQVVRVDAQVDVPVPAVLHPVLVPFLVGARLDEELHLHLLELAGAEDEVARRDLVAEALAGLADPERRLLARGIHHVEVVDEDALGGLGAQEVLGAGVLHRADHGAQHAVEVAGLGELPAGAAVGADDVGQAVLGSVAVLLLVGLDQAGRHASACGTSCTRSEDRRMHSCDRRPPTPAGEDHRGVQTDNVIAAPDNRLPPLAADVLLELNAQRAVVPRRAGPPVDLGGREHEPPALAQVDDLVDAVDGH